jgi:hypothetical protein
LFLYSIVLVELTASTGTVEITVHDGRVVQIERKEKIRFAPDRRMPTAHSQNTIPTGPPEVS